MTSPVNAADCSQELEVSQSSKPTTREVWLVSLATLAVTLLYVLNAAMHGALGASRNDDWAYLRVAFRFVETGKFSLDGWTQMAFIGQALVAWPVGKLFGPDIRAMQLLVAGLGWVGVVACYFTIRSFAGKLVSSFAVGLLLVGPLFGSLATSFMTDVPSFCFQMLTLLCAVRLITNGWDHRLFVALCLCGVFATSVREYGLIVLVVTVASVGLYSRPRGRQRTVFVAGTAMSTLLIIGLLTWRAGVRHGDPNGATLIWVFEGSQMRAGLEVAARGLVTLAFLLTPVAVLAVSRRTAERIVHSPARAAIVVAVWAAVGWLSRLNWVGNYVTASGSYRPLIEGSTPPVLPTSVDNLARWIAFLSLLGVLLLVVLGRDDGPTLHRGPRRTWFQTVDRSRMARLTVTATALALACVHIALLMVSNTPFFDRYLIVFVPVVVAVAASGVHDVSWPMSRLRAGMVGLVFVCLGLTGMKFVDASATLDGAKWRYGERAANSGFAPESIDAGFEWFNFHQQGTVTMQAGPDRNWWTAFYPTSAVCVTVVAGPRSEGLPDDGGVEPFVAHSAFGAVYRFSSVTGPSSC